MNYRESVGYLESFWKFGIKLGLDRTRQLLDHLDNPHHRFWSIHIGGTNGKGSVGAMLSSILCAAGFKVGLYTSPHLIDYTERIRINGKDISQQKFVRHLEKIRSIIQNEDVGRPAGRSPDFGRGEGRPTEFEILTALAFSIFADEKIDLAAVEVGLGGRLDATNVLSPSVSVITNVDYDHTEILGKDLEKIAYEKVGIIKTEVPLVTAASQKEVQKVIREKCKQESAPLFVVTDSVLKVQGEKGQQVTIQGRYGKYKSLHLPLRGYHQALNAAVAIGTVEVLKDQGIQISEENIRCGLQRVAWPGRFEVISGDPLIILDAAHNPAGAKSLKETLIKFIKDKPLTLILGMLSYKDIPGVVTTLAPISKLVITTKSGHPQAASPEYIASLVRKSDIEVKITHSVREALDLASTQDGVTCITGSLFTVGEALQQVQGKP